MVIVSYGDGNNVEGGIGSDDGDSGDIMVLMMVVVMITKCVLFKTKIKFTKPFFFVLKMSVKVVQK